MLILLQISVPLDFVRGCLLTDIIFKILMPSCNTDVSDAIADYNVDCGNTDVSLPRRLYVLRRHVRHSFIPSPSGTDRGFRYCSGNGRDDPPKIDRMVSDTKQTTAIPLPRKQMEVTMEISHERWQSSASQTGHYMFSDGQFGDKLGGQNLDDDVESGAEKYIPN